jgi:hypothetical protein
MPKDENQGSEREVGKDEYHEVRAFRRERGPRSGNYNPVGRANFYLDCF